MGYNFVYFNKERNTFRNENDVRITISKKKKNNSARITFSNVPMSDVSKTGFLRFATLVGDMNRLFFIATDKENGYTLRWNESMKSFTALVTQVNIVDLLKRFEGKYSLEIDDENYVFIDRRNAL